MLASAFFSLFLAIALDTDFYTPGYTSWSTLFSAPVITPLNNLRYNLESSNLALHGIHPRYQHLVANLPQLLGPAFILLCFRSRMTIRLVSAITGVLVLSIFQHQEARFLLPAIPLFLSSVQLPRNKRRLKLFGVVWVLFNSILGVLMGLYHQGGIVPTQFHIAQHVGDATEALWWKTYSPPVWLLDGKNEVLTTHDLMGIPGEEMLTQLEGLATCDGVGGNGTYLVAPLSATFLDEYTSGTKGDEWRTRKHALRFEEVFTYRTHLNLDDLDFGGDGVWPTLQRVVGRRGLATWRVTKDCKRR
jgi:phosphatidylinositol glycan class Z